MARYQEKTQLTFLLMGKSGVGKSRFINSVANYLKYEKLSDVSNLQIPIPCTVQYTHKAGNLRTALVGNDEENGNECLEVGKSGTRTCRRYDFVQGSLHLTLIDAPGLVDTSANVDQDEINLKNILQFISSFKEIHGICIFLRPDERRFDTTMHYYFHEILKQFHTSAAQNLLFTFTHCGRFNFPGGSTGTFINNNLEKLRREECPELGFGPENSFFFNNEAFEYLVARGRDAIFEEEDVLQAEKWWTKSRSQMLRMIEYAKGLSPHMVDLTLGIYRARTLVEGLSPLILQISKAIVTNENHVLVEELLVEEFEGTVEEFRQQIRSIRSRVMTQHHDAPRVVCHSPLCTEEVEDPVGGGRTQSHATCYTFPGSFQKIIGRFVPIGYLTGLLAMPFDEMAAGAALASVGTPVLVAGGLLAGAAGAGGYFWYRNGTCTTCQCNVYHHKISYLETNIVEEEITNEDMEEEYMIHLTLQEAKKIELDRLRQELVSLVQQRELVEQANSVFAVFLKQRTITAYNDSYLDYLGYLVRNEETKAGGRDWAKVEVLKRKQEEYKEKIRVIEEADPNDGSAIHWTEIDLSFIEAQVENLKLNLEEEYSRMVEETVGAWKREGQMMRGGNQVEGVAMDFDNLGFD